MARMIASAPILLVRDVVKAAEYFRDRVGFTPDRFWDAPPNFCIVRRDGLALMLSQIGPDDAVTPHWRVVPFM